MENPFNDNEIRADFIKLGYEEPKIKSMYQMFEKIRKGTQQGNPPLRPAQKEQAPEGIVRI